MLSAKRISLALLILTLPLLGGYVALTPCELELAMQKEGPTMRMAQEMIQLANLALYATPKPVVSLTPYKLPCPTPSVYVAEVKKDFTRIEALGYATAFLDRDLFCFRAEYFLKAWCAKYNMVEQEIHPLDVTGMIHLLKGYSLVRPHMTCFLRSSVDKWLQGIAQGLIETACYDKTMLDNATRSALVGMIGFLIDDCSYTTFALKEFVRFLTEDPVPHTFADKAEVKSETHILIYHLELAVTAARNDNSIIDYKPEGCCALLERVDRLLPYLAGKQPPLFPGREQAVHLLQLAAYFDPVYLTFPVYGTSWKSLEGYLNTLHHKL